MQQAVLLERCRLATEPSTDSPRQGVLPRWPQQFIMLKNLPTGGALHRGWGAEAAGSQGNSGLGSLFGFLCFSFSPSLKGRWETSNLQDPGRSTHCGLNNQNNVWKLDLTHETNSLFPAKYFLLSFCFRHHSLCQKESSVSRPRWSSPDTVWPWANHFCPLDLPRL